MRAFLFGLLMSISACAIQPVQPQKADQQPAIMNPPGLDAAPPLTAVAMVQCNQLIAVCLTRTADKRLVCYDKKSGIEAQVLANYALTARSIQVVEANCPRPSNVTPTKS